MIDEHDLRKWHIESEMIAGRNPQRIMSEKFIPRHERLIALDKAIDKQDLKTPEEKKLADALARIAALEKELVEARKDKERNEN